MGFLKLWLLIRMHLSFYLSWNCEIVYPFNPCFVHAWVSHWCSEMAFIHIFGFSSVATTYQIPFYEALSQLLNLKTWSSGNSAYSVFGLRRFIIGCFFLFFLFLLLEHHNMMLGHSIRLGQFGIQTLEEWPFSSISMEVIIFIQIIPFVNDELN